jgi:predicted ATPase
VVEAVQIIVASDEKVLRLRGSLLRAEGDLVAAQCPLSCAPLPISRVFAAIGKRDEARDLLAPVYGWFTEGFDTRDLKEAKAMLATSCQLEAPG